jgi:hypothetical protein
MGLPSRGLDLTRCRTHISASSRKLPVCLPDLTLVLIQINSLSDRNKRIREKSAFCQLEPITAD